MRPCKLPTRLLACDCRGGGGGAGLGGAITGGAIGGITGAVTTAIGGSGAWIRTIDGGTIGGGGTLGMPLGGGGGFSGGRGCSSTSKVLRSLAPVVLPF